MVGKAVSVGMGVRSSVNGPEVGVDIVVSLPVGEGVEVDEIISPVDVANRPGDNDCGWGVTAVPACVNGRDAHPAINKAGINNQDRMIRTCIMSLLSYPGGAAGRSG